MLANLPPAWDDGPLVLYHGTLDSAVASILGGIDLTYCRPYRDFGRGFYTTTLLRQAVSRASGLSRLAPRPDPPAVVAFEIDLGALSNLESLAFVRSEFEAELFWSFVWRCRQSDVDHGRPSNGGWYDVVVGSLAADWQQRAAFVNSDQLSFHTPAGARLLDAGRPRRIL